MNRGLTQQLIGLFNNVLDGKAEVLEQLASRGRLTKGGHANHAAIETNVFVPVVGMASFDGNTLLVDRRSE